MTIVTTKQRKIIDAFFLAAAEAPEPKKITMEMVAEKAGIRRQNIYSKHFATVEDLINTIHGLVDEECEEKVHAFVASGKGDLIAFFAEEILPLLYEKREWLKILYGNVVDSSWMEYLQKKYTPIIKVYLGKTKNNSGLPDEFLYNLIVRQIIAVIANWLTSDTPEPASIFQKEFIFILSSSTYDLLSTH